MQMNARRLFPHSPSDLDERDIWLFSFLPSPTKITMQSKDLRTFEGEKCGITGASSTQVAGASVGYGHSEEDDLSRSEVRRFDEVVLKLCTRNLPSRIRVVGTENS